jgi:hypothetical protein
MRSWSRVGWRPVDEWDGGFGWVRDERMQRASHALLVDGGVWLIDPVDEPEVEERVRALGEPAGVLQLLDRHSRGCAAWAARLGVPHRRAWERVPPPFEGLPVREGRWWKEVALWERSGCTLVCADALGTAGYFRSRHDRIGVHPLLRVAPPRVLASVEPERVLVGHGAGVFDDAAGAVREALATARRRLPAALLSGTRSGSAASTS